MTVPDWYTDGAMASFVAMAGPPLAVCLVLGVVGAILQTTTQIREAAITFVPKAIGLLLVIGFGGALMFSVDVRYARHVFQQLGPIIRVGEHD
jgi:flagellar biosynthesis protein FliQ